MPSNILALNLNCEFLFDSLSSQYEGYEFITQGSLYNFLGIILQNKLYTVNNNMSLKTNDKIILFKKVLLFIEENYTQTLSLNDLSKVAGMTPKYLCKFFNNMSNKTPIEYLNFYRIEIACEQLLSTDLSVTDIAINCGFNDVSYFIKTFKKYKGITPKQYIKKIF